MTQLLHSLTIRRFCIFSWKHENMKNEDFCTSLKHAWERAEEHHHRVYGEWPYNLLCDPKTLGRWKGVLLIIILGQEAATLSFSNKP